MIFVTVGTHEQQFDRLVEEIDSLKGTGAIQDDVFIQTGYSTYKPKYCAWSNFVPFADMNRYVSDAAIVITHGGPSSFIMPLQIGKIPVVVPRQKKYDEHVNDHQLEFAHAVAERQKNIIVVEDICDLKDIILRYDEHCQVLSVGGFGNNSSFNREFKRIVNEITINS